MVFRAVRIRGLKITARNMRKLDNKIKGPIKKQMLVEMGQKTKGYAQRIIQSNAVASGNLLKNMHYRVFEDRVSIWNSAGKYAWSWERGMRPHFIHRDMISDAGYTVGDWMNSKGMSPKRNFLLVGTGPIGMGIQFMERSATKLRKALPNILTRYAKMMR